MVLYMGILTLVLHAPGSVTKPCLRASLVVDALLQTTGILTVSIVGCWLPVVLRIWKRLGGLRASDRVAMFAPVLFVQFVFAAVCLGVSWSSIFVSRLLRAVQVTLAHSHTHTRFAQPLENRVRQ